MPATPSLIDELLAAAPTPALRVGPDGVVAFRNRAFVDDIGHTPEAEQAALRALSGSNAEIDGQLWSATVTDAGSEGLVLFLRPDDSGLLPKDLQKRRKFLSVASHDLRGLLANVRSWASILSSPRVQMDDRGKRGTEIIIRNTDKAIALMQEFFDSARADLTPVPVDIQPQDLRSEIDKIAKEVESGDPDRPVRVSVHLFADVTSVPVDLDRFRHILRAFLEHGRDRVSANDEVELDIKRERDGLSFEVKDRGPAPTAEELLATFDRDQRTVTEKKLGAGFRLAFAAAEVAAHRGKVHSEAVGDGARFGFWLPVGAVG